jgi:hypothetical protein
VNPLPKKDWMKMADYCKSYWNRTGKATPEKYLNDYLRWRDDDQVLQALDNMLGFIVKQPLHVTLRQMRIVPYRVD